jgi:outer membrane protein OmpA-like peptidoglycan-associated protein
MRTFASRPKMAPLAAFPRPAGPGLMSREVSSILHGQRTVGNRVVQAKLKVNAPGDVYEQEADRVADEVLRKPDAGTATQGGLVQRQETAAEAPEVTPAVAAGLDATKGKGEPLPGAVRSFMEPRFGADLGEVRVHRGSEAAWLNRELKARAFTHQRDVYFGANEYAPDSTEGKRLLAHELTHVIQQSQAAPAVQRQEKPETEADVPAVADSVVEAMGKRNPIAGVGDVDEAFGILNPYSVPFLRRVLAELYVRGSFHALLGYLAPGTKANEKVVVAIRFIQCEREPENLGLPDIREALSFLGRLYPGGVPEEYGVLMECLERERIRREVLHERRLGGARRGSRKLAQGTMEWWLAPMSTFGSEDYRGQPSAMIQIVFTLNAANRNKTITFLQTVQQSKTATGKAGSIPLLDIGKDAPFEPFYGADFAQKRKAWVPEGAAPGFKNAPSTPGSGAAYLYDEPSVPPSQTKMFESVVVVPATGETLGSLKWGVNWAKYTAQLVGGEITDCKEAPSADYQVALERFYAVPKDADVSERMPIGEQHYAAILDGFAPNQASLTPDHEKQLAAVMAQFKKFEHLGVALGGFADASEADPFSISQERADRVRSYLIDHGVAKDRIRAGRFGAAWARVPPGAKETRNRRVQIFLYFK